MPLNFFIIVLAQFFFFLFFYVRNRTTKVSLVKMVLLSLVAGLIGGLLFDITFGMLGAYVYKVEGNKDIFYSTGLSLYQLIWNDILSFGLAVLTSYYITSKKELYKKKAIKNDVIGVLSFLVLLSIALSFLVQVGVVALFIYGVGVIAFGECLLVLRGQNGPFLSLLMTRNYSSFIVFWANTVLIGFLYEVVNYLFPFWVWLPRSDYSHLSIEILIVLFGYMVVLHPMVVFWKIVGK